MTPPRILVVDDEPAILRSVERVLSPPYQVACTHLPGEAVGLAETFAPDLVILDIRMPDMDGFELMGRLKAGRSDLEIILMTGSVRELDTQLIRALREKAFYFLQKPFDREVLQTLVERCLELRRLEKENHRHLKRLEQELAEARAFQQSRLPPDQAVVGSVAVAARYLPSSELGGDVYDYIAAGQDGATLLVADVSGHGASAAMLTGVVKSAFHSASVEGYEPLSIVARVSSGIRAFGHERFITLVCVRVSTVKSVLEYVNAGHPPGVLWGPDRGTVLMEATGPLISPAFPDSSWKQETLRLRQQDRLLLFTDGVEDVGGEQGFFGLGRIVQEVRKNPGGGVRLLDQILNSVREFTGGRRIQDDLTLLTADLGSTELLSEVC
jgi:sigma-B regulation protein RsbU (phosphoserine phosphatase)